MFVPGQAESNSNIAPIAGLRSRYDAAVATLVGTANADLQIWSRSYALAASVTLGTMWNKWAVLRSRRD